MLEQPVFKMEHELQQNYNLQTAFVYASDLDLIPMFSLNNLYKQSEKGMELVTIGYTLSNTTYSLIQL